MSTNSTVCPQCNKELNISANRLVVDSCGHKKCRKCLLEDEEQCKQCITPPKNTSQTQDTHTAVIKSFTNTTTNEFIESASVLVPNPPKQEPNVNSHSVNGDQMDRSSKLHRKKVKVNSKRNVKHKRPYHRVTIPDYISMYDPLRYKCNICNKIFATKSHIRYHLYCAGRVEKPHKCQICSKQFVTRSHLCMHLLKHSDAKLFMCEMCDKTFNEQSKLNRHRVVHAHLKTHICSECGRAFKNSDSLKVHSITHTGEKPYVCNICKAGFNNSSNLRKHLVSHSNEKAHMCDQCGKRFKLKWALTVHRKSHLKLRQHICAVCSKTFINYKDLQRHQMIHLDSKLYSCSVCTAEFKRKDNLLRHIKSAHPGKKAEVLKKSLELPLPLIPPKHVMDNPNAIKVITASPLVSKIELKNNYETTSKKSDHRSGTVINGPLKLAFKTDAFKNSYNIQRDYEPPGSSNDSFDFAESVNICQKILTPVNPTRNIIQKVSDVTSSEICQKILTPYTAPPPKPTLNFESSFEHKKYGPIRNIKFKLPPDYINLKSNNTLSNIIPLKGAGTTNGTDQLLTNNNNNSKTYAELKTNTNAATSVIVNTNMNLQTNSDMHWRRRTFQNFNLRNLDH